MFIASASATQRGIERIRQERGLIAPIDPPLRMAAPIVEPEPEPEAERDPFERLMHDYLGYRLYKPRAGKKMRGKYHRMIEAIAAFHGVHEIEIIGDSKIKPVTLARWHAIYELARNHPKMSNSDIGRLLKKDHTTIGHALRTFMKVTANRGFELPPLSREVPNYAGSRAVGRAA